MNSTICVVVFVFEGNVKINDDLQFQIEIFDTLWSLKIIMCPFALTPDFSIK